jgi:hypothetical protein
VQAIVYGTAADAVVGRTLLDNIAAGIGSAGAESYTETVDGAARTVRWREATAVGIQVRITGLVASGDLDAARTAVRAAVAAAIDGLEIGADVLLARVYIAAVTVPAVTELASLEIRKVGDAFGITNLTIDVAEKAVVTTPGTDITFP